MLPINFTKVVKMVDEKQEEKQDEKPLEKKRLTKSEIEEALLNNFVSLQSVLTNLAIKFDGLSNNINKLLQLFEISAQSIANKGGNKFGIDQDFLKKLDNLLDQNKTIAKGIMMMEERVRNKMSQESKIPQEQRTMAMAREGFNRSPPLYKNQ